MTQAAITRIILTVVSLAIALLHMQNKSFVPDHITAFFIILATVPWLYPIIKSIEISGVGKLELQLDEVAKRQETLRKEIDALRFLLLGFVTDFELVHLRKLNQEGEFHYVRGADKGDRFTAEIIRLWDLGLVSRKVPSFWNMDLEGDLKKYAEITDRGRLYLKLRDEYQGLK